MAKSLARSAALMASGTTVSRLLGFVRVILLAYAIGQTSSASADAFAVGATVPGIINMLLMGGMLNSVLVPQIVAAAKNSDGGSSYINKLVTLLGICAFGLTVATMLLAVPLVKINAFNWHGAQFELALIFAYWSIPQLMCYAGYTVFGEILNARRCYGPHTWAPVLNNLITIAGIIAFIVLFGADPNGERSVESWGWLPIAVLAGSATLGSALQAAILLPFWKSVGIKFRPDFRFRGVGLSKALKLSAWTFGTLLLINIIALVCSNVLATAAGQGSGISAFGNAWLVIVLPHSILVVSLGIVYFTRLAEHVSSGATEEYSKDFYQLLRQSLLCIVFAVAAIIAVAPQLSRLIQLRADAEYVAEFSWLLIAYAPALIGHSMLFIVQRGFYALSDTRTPFLLTFVQLAVVLPLAFAGLLVPAQQRAIYIAGISALGMFVQFVVGYRLLKQRALTHGDRSLGDFAARVSVAALIVAVIGSAISNAVWRHYPEMPVFTALVSSALLGIGLAFLYFVLLRVFQVPDAQQLVRMLRRR